AMFSLRHRTTPWHLLLIPLGEDRSSGSLDEVMRSPALDPWTFQFVSHMPAVILQDKLGSVGREIPIRRQGVCLSNHQSLGATQALFCRMSHRVLVILVRFTASSCTP